MLHLEKAGFILVFFSAVGKVQFEIYWHHSKADEVGRPLMIDPGSFWQHISLEPKHKENTLNLGRLDLAAIAGIVKSLFSYFGRKFMSICNCSWGIAGPVVQGKHKWTNLFSGEKKKNVLGLAKYFQIVKL